MRLRRWLLLAGLLLGLAGCSASTDSGLPGFPDSFPPSQSIRVPQDFSTITEAVARASPGDTILVAAGVYNESVPVAKAVTLLGSGPATILNAQPGLPAMLVIAPSRISGFTLNGTTRVLVVGGGGGAVSGVQLDNLVIRASEPDGIGLLFQDAPGIRILDCRVEAHLLAVGGGLAGGPSPDALLTRVTAVLLGGAADAVGFFFGNTPDLRMLDCLARGPEIALQGVQALPLSATGLVARDFEGRPVTGLAVENLQVELPGDQTSGVFFGNAPGASFRGGTVTAGFNGIVVQTPEGTAVPNVVLEDFQILLRGPQVENGVRCVNTPDLVVRAGTVTGGARGVQLVPAAGVPEPVPGILVEGVQVSGAPLGIAGVNQANPTVRACLVDGGDFGIGFQDSLDLVVQGCRVVNAGTAAVHLEGVAQDPQVLDNVLGTSAVGVNFQAPPNGAVVAGNVIAGNNFGVLIPGGTASVLRNRFDGNSIAVDCGGNAQLLCANNLLLNSPQAGLVLEGESFALAHNNVAAGNGAGFEAQGTAGLTAVSNLFFFNLVGLNASGTGAVASDFNDYFGNALGDGPFGILPGPGDVSVDPLFVDVVSFVLGPASPVIDLGIPDPDFNDRIPPGQGTPVNDMGTYGGPTAGDIPPPVVLARQAVPRTPGRRLSELLESPPIPQRWRVP